MPINNSSPIPPEPDQPDFSTASESPGLADSLDTTAQPAESQAEAGNPQGSQPEDAALGSEQHTRQTFSWRWILLLLFAGLVFYMVVIPSVAMTIDRFTPKPAMRAITDMSLAEYIRLHSMSGVILMFFLTAGASIGSFLNVFIYRLPRRRALLWPPSGCPNCGYQIRGRDNIPILAWVGLRGRCRQCQVAISSRYPIIEVVVASVFVLFFYVELLSGGKNLPVREPNLYNGVVWIVFYTKWDLLTIYFFHVSLLTLLLGWAMINWDRFRVPRLSASILLLIFSGLAIAFPHLNPLTAKEVIVPWFALPSWLSASLWICSVGLVIGFASGLLLQCSFPLLPLVPPAKLAKAVQSPTAPNSTTQLEATAEPDLATETDLAPELESTTESITSHDQAHRSLADLYGSCAAQPNRWTDAVWSMMLLGATLGPQAALAILLLTVLLGLPIRLAGCFVGSLKRIPITLTLFGAALLHQLFWRQTQAIPLNWFPSPKMGYDQVFLIGGSVLVAAITLAWFRKHGSPSPRV